MYIVGIIVDDYSPFTSMGRILILVGLLLVVLPNISRVIPGVERIPWFILYVYRRDGFYFVTSSLLILLSLISILFNRSSL